MQIDITILIVIVLFAILGFKNGLLYTLSQTFGWICAFVAAFFLYKKLAEFFITQTHFYDDFYTRIFEVCNKFIASLTGGVAGSVPGQYGETLDEMGDKIASDAADKIAVDAFNVIVFLIIVVTVKIILYILMKLLSKRYRNGFVGGFDAAFGLLVGLFQGVVVVFVLLLLVMPIAFLISPGVYAAMQIMMDKSLIAEMLYLNNPLLILIDGYMPGVLSPEKWIPSRSDFDFTMKDWENIK
jgi:uncharacterized membrane protein required for colicin V production